MEEPKEWDSLCLSGNNNETGTVILSKKPITLKIDRHNGGTPQDAPDGYEEVAFISDALLHPRSFMPDASESVSVKEGILFKKNGSREYLFIFT